MNSDLLIKNNGFDFGLTKVTDINEKANNTMMDFSILKLRPGEIFNINKEADSKLEYACLLLKGHAELKIEDTKYNLDYTAKRKCIFEEDPIVVNVGQNTVLSIKAVTDIECALVATTNNKDLKPQIFDSSNMLESDKRGKGLLSDTAYRVVRTSFDTRNNPDSNLVIGEVINFPGCWSSYPPHHHKQPEIYHYRFTEPQGYGHAELGESVLKVKNFDTVKILDKATHSQVAAPGYGMYYIWVIRHLDNNPYILPTFVDEHSWTKDESANNRVWGSK